MDAILNARNVDAVRKNDDESEGENFDGEEKMIDALLIIATEII